MKNITEYNLQTDYVRNTHVWIGSIILGLILVISQNNPIRI